MKEKRKLVLKKTTVVKLSPLPKDEKGIVRGGANEGDVFIIDKSKCCATCHCGA